MVQAAPLGSSRILSQQQRVADAVRAFHVWKELLRASFRDVLIAVCAAAHHRLPLHRQHFIEGNTGCGERHLQRTIVAAERERRDDAHFCAGPTEHAWIHLLDHGAHVALDVLRRVAADQVEEIAVGLRHFERPVHDATIVDARDAAGLPRIDAEKQRIFDGQMHGDDFPADRVLVGGLPRPLLLHDRDELRRPLGLHGRRGHSRIARLHVIIRRVVDPF